MSAPIWAADVAVDVERAAALVAARFPAFAGARVEAFGSGWDNAAFLVDGSVVFRFPRRHIAAALLERECALLPSIAMHVPLPISAPKFVANASAAFPYPFAGYARIAGRTLDAAALDDDARAALAEPLGAFLHALHALDPAPLISRGLPGDEIGRLDFDKRVRATRERLPVLATAGIAEPERLVRLLEERPPRTVDARALRVVHGDLYGRHVLVEGSRPSGIIDWGDVHLGDPAVDLAVAYLVLPHTAHARFAAAYGGIDDDAWSTARFRAIYHAVVELDYGVRANDPGMRALGTEALRLLATAT